jgi:L-rhamnose-H+ transport protein
MNLIVLYGVLFIALGAFMSGSFAIPFDKIKNWQWENYWMIYCLFGYIIVPGAICLLFVPNIMALTEQVPLHTLRSIFLLGVVYGTANITFGLSLRYLGFALGYALSLVLMMAIGTLVPPLINGRLAGMFEGNGGAILVTGVLISLVGIAISGYAGFLKSSQVETNKGVNKEFNIRKGIAVAVFNGIAGSSVALGLEQGIPVAEAAIANGADPLFQDSVVFLILYSGSFLTSLIWCLYLAVKNKSVKNFVQSRGHALWKNYIACALAGFLWFITFLFFGMGKSKMDDFSFVAWGILMSMTIVCATFWGLYRKEWKNVSKKTYLLMWIGLIILVLASFLIGISTNTN